jgi:hypothetical protein
MSMSIAGSADDLAAGAGSGASDRLRRRVWNASWGVGGACVSAESAKLAWASAGSARLAWVGTDSAGAVRVCPGPAGTAGAVRSWTAEARGAGI